MAETEREKMQVDVLLVGCGVASLACAYQIAKKIKIHDEAVEQGKIQAKKIGPVEIAILEKTADIGGAICSGAVMDPSSISQLIPNWRELGAPVESDVLEDAVYYFTKNKALRFPITPPPLRQHGYSIISLSKFTRWLAEQVQALGVNIFTGFAGSQVLYDGQKVIGVRTGDKGIDKQGNRKSNFEAGIDILAKVTLLGEGVRGSLTRDHINKLELDHGVNPPSFATGVKEVWELKDGAFEKGCVFHTMGFPQKRGLIGGGWLYGMDNNLLSLGYVTWLSYRDPYADPHQNFQTFKSHPFIKKILSGGKMIQYGAKAVSVGGYYSIPKITGDGFLLIGESANLVDGQRLKGVHLAIGSGMLAGITVFEALKKNDFSEAFLKQYQDRFENSEMKQELLLSRNFHQAFDSGFLIGMARTGIQSVLKGRDLLGDRLKSALDRSHMEKRSAFHGLTDSLPTPPKYDNLYLYDKLTDVYNSGTMHEEDQPSHLQVPNLDLCSVQCTQEYGNPCTRFCPAQVYEMEEANGKLHLKINASNCVHCKTCDIMDPYTNIRWVTPEGGGGPRYTLL